MVYCLQEINGITAALAEELFHKGKELAAFIPGMFSSLFMHSHIFHILPPDNEIWFSISDWYIFSPFFLFVFFFAACTYSSCILWGAATVLQPLLETGNWWMYVWKRASWSVSLRDRMWQWWSGAFAKLSGSVCFSVTCKEAWSVSVSPDSLCTKCKRSLWISKYYSSRIQDTGDLLVS